MTNPLLETWTDNYGLPPFDRIEDAHFGPAVEAALEDGRARIAAIAGDTAEPTFANTIEELEGASALLDQVLSVFFSVAGADSNPAREALMREISPKVSAYSADVFANDALFARVEAIWQARDSLDLNGEQQQLLRLNHRTFVRMGARLDVDGKARLKQIMGRLAELGTAFSQNLLADEKAWRLPLADAELAGLPDWLVDAAKGAGDGAPVITVSRSLVVPFLQFSPHRALRQKTYTAWTSRGANGGEYDNRALAAETLKLREERAKLLGYDSFADYKLEIEMAGTPGAVRDLLMQVWTPAKAAAEADAKVLEQMLHADGIEGPLEAWDWHYYSEKRRQAEHDLDETELKPYLQLNRMIDAAQTCAGRLFGLEFEELDVPMYHPDVRTWRVTRAGQEMAIFICDFFARPSKRSGAWCGTMRDQQKLAGDMRAHITNVCNFAKPAEGRPALLSYDDARTLFHEFGHALHHMLSDVTYEHISGTSVARDFVELPSQLYEHWLEVPEVLAEFATHADTGEPMPKEMLDRLLAAGTYDMGFQTVEYVSSALVDLAFHDGPVPADPMQKQAEVLEEIGMPAAIAMRHATPHFQHVFAGDGYSSGYYSYMWSEVMDADAFAAFEEAGDPFDAELAKRLEETVLSSGGSVDAAELYTAFRGRMPGVEPLLKGRGLVDAA